MIKALAPVGLLICWALSLTAPYRRRAGRRPGDCWRECCHD